MKKNCIENILDKFKCFDRFNDVVYFDIMIKPDFRKAKDGKILDYSTYLVYEEREFNPELNTDSLSIKYFAEKERFTVTFKRGIFTEKFSVSKRVAIHKNVIKGNGFQKIYYSPSKGIYEDNEFIASEQLEDYERDENEINSVCVN